jgi:hypothetical protein
LTDAKQHKLQETYVSFKEIASSTFQKIQASKPRTYTALHHAVYPDNKRREIASQLVEEAQRYAWQRRTIADRIVKRPYALSIAFSLGAVQNADTPF